MTDRPVKLSENQKTRKQLIKRRTTYFEQGGIERKTERRMINYYEQENEGSKLLSIAPIQRAFIETILKKHEITLPEKISETIIPESAHTNDVSKKNLIKISQETHEKLLPHLTQQEETKIAHYFHESNVKALKRLFKKLKKYHKQQIKLKTMLLHKNKS
ncbi:Uncharacterised protein [uncultured archaeon]|nr:Uncharacterised protein [uncultured archaeon]